MNLTALSEQELRAMLKELPIKLSTEQLYLYNKLMIEIFNRGLQP